MKQHLYLFFTLAIATNLVSQESAEPLKIGFYTAVKTGINTSTIPTGWKTGISIDAMPDIGVSVLIPLSETAGLATLISAGLSSNSTTMKPFYTANDSNSFEFRSTYLCFAPALALRYFEVGVNLGLPLSATLTNHEGSTQARSFSHAQGTTNFIDECGILTELRICGTLPLIQDDTGTLSMFLEGSYQLSGQFKSFATVSDAIYTNTKTSADSNPRNASLSLGLRYLFDWTSSE